MIYRKAAAYIHPENLVNNLREIRRLAGSAKVCAVIKADAYGHGAITVSQILDKEGIDYLAVALLEEALELRSAGVASPLLVLGTTDPSNADIIVSQNITQTVFTAELAQALSVSARRLDHLARIHVKIDTGMHRQGIAPEEAESFTRLLASLPGLVIEGVYSHFAEADNPDTSFSMRQLAEFRRALEGMRAVGVRPPIRHISNSAALLHIPEARFDMVRPGILFYGLSPDADPKPPKGFAPVMQLCASIATIRGLEKGESVSYGRLFTARRDSRIALLQIGYADGYSRLLSNKAEVIVRGRKAPIAGRVCMDQIMVDVTDIPDAALGDEATLFGLPELPVGELARLMGTIDYEVTCGISKRVPRITKETTYVG
ncbi:MAG TPA: alanine racemase [Rectinemataceae bacterium]|nr:alanine racemase [Rectinemataceae bacterium]